MCYSYIKAIPHTSKCRYGERGAADAKPKAQIILDAAKMYEQTQAAQGEAGAGPDMSGMGGNAQAGASSADDDVVDEDFKEV